MLYALTNDAERPLVDEMFTDILSEGAASATLTVRARGGEKAVRFRIRSIVRQSRMLDPSCVKVYSFLVTLEAVRDGDRSAATLECGAAAAAAEAAVPWRKRRPSRPVAIPVPEPEDLHERMARASAAHRHISKMLSFVGGHYDARRIDTTVGVRNLPEAISTCGILAVNTEATFEQVAPAGTRGLEEPWIVASTTSDGRRRFPYPDTLADYKPPKPTNLTSLLKRIRAVSALSRRKRHRTDSGAIDAAIEQTTASQSYDLQDTIIRAFKSREEYLRRNARSSPADHSDNCTSDDRSSVASSSSSSMSDRNFSSGEEGRSASDADLDLDSAASAADSSSGTESEGASASSADSFYDEYDGDSAEGDEDEDEDEDAVGFGFEA